MTGVPALSPERTQRIYARLAGFLFLWLIVTGVTGMLTISHIVGSGSFLEQANRVAASQRLYRFGLIANLVETLSALLLAFALYATLRPANKLLAQLAMYWRVAESLIGCVSVIFGFVKLRLYVSPQSIAGLGTQPAQALMDVLRQVGVASYNIGALSFSIGSALFFYLFLKSRYIPRALSAFGIFASVVVSLVCFGTLLFPEYSGKLQYGWAPIAIAEVVTGIWLMIFAIKTPAPAI